MGFEKETVHIINLWLLFSIMQSTGYQNNKLMKQGKKHNKNKNKKVLEN